MFTKGQKVHYIAKFNAVGDYAVRPAEVVSCGKKQMVLKDADTGVVFGRHYRPQVMQSWTNNKDGEQTAISAVYADLTEDEAFTKAADLATAYAPYNCDAKADHTPKAIEYPAKYR